MAEVDLTGTQKAAIILLSVTEENATKLFSLMNEEEIKEVSYAMSNLGSIKPDKIAKVLTAFANDVSNDAALLGNIFATEKLLEKILGKDKLHGLLEDIKGPKGKNTWEKLGNVNEEVLASYLKNEYPQTAALVLSKVEPEHAANVLTLLPEQFALEVMLRMINITSVKKEIVDRVEKILKSEFISSIAKTQKQDSYALMAEIFNRFDRNSSAKYMGLIEAKNAEYATKIKDLMFTFDDLSSLDAKGIQTLLRSIDKLKLTAALKGSSPKVRDLFIANMSARASRILLEEIEALGPIKVKDVDEAQGSILNVAKELIAKGEIEISEEGKDEYIQ